MQPTQAVLTMMLVWAAVLHQSAPAPLRHIRSPPNSQVDERPSQNCSSIATDYPILAWRLFLSSVKQKNFTLPVGVHHETRSVSWKRHSTVQNGKHHMSKYTKCRDTGETLPTTTTLSNSSRSLCQWTYECDYDAGRLPAFVHHAKCRSNVFLHNNSLYQCKPISTSIKVIRLKGCTADSDTEDWRVENYVISSGCAPFRL